jgi:hypothetical protein
MWCGGCSICTTKKKKSDHPSQRRKKQKWDRETDDPSDTTCFSGILRENMES